MVSNRVVQRGREHPSRKSRKTALDFQGQTVSERAVLLSLEIDHVGAFVLDITGAAPGGRDGLTLSVLPGSKNGAKGHEGSPGT